MLLNIKWTVFFSPYRKMFYYLMLRPQRDDKSQKYLSLYIIMYSRASIASAM